MNRTLIALFLLLAGMLLAACTTPDDEAEAAKAKAAAAPLAPLVAPKTGDDKEWKIYLQQVVQRNMAGVTDRVFPYYLPNNSTVPTPEDQDGKSMYDRQLENVATVISRTVLPGNMLVFGSPDSAKMADLIVASFTGAPADALKGSQVLFIGNAADSARVQPVVEAVGAKYIFVEAK
jgi:hypothetical protein